MCIFFKAHVQQIFSKILGHGRRASNSETGFYKSVLISEFRGNSGRQDLSLCISHAGDYFFHFHKIQQRSWLLSASESESPHTNFSNHQLPPTYYPAGLDPSFSGKKAEDISLLSGIESRSRGSRR